MAETEVNYSSDSLSNRNDHNTGGRRRTQGVLRNVIADNAALTDKIAALRDALRVRYGYQNCPECGVYLVWGKVHMIKCRHYAVEQAVMQDV